MTKSFFLAAIFVSSLVLSCGSTLSEGSELLQQNTKRVVGYLDDSILPKRWAIMQDDAHPQAPRTLVPVASATAVPRPPAAIMFPDSHHQTVIRAGEAVTLFDDSATLHLQLAAVAIESAVLGGRLRVRLVQGGAILNGVVLSPHRVKLQSMAKRLSMSHGTMQ